jgi:hypothetical protein
MENANYFLESGPENSKRIAVLPSRATAPPVCCARFALFEHGPTLCPAPRTQAAHFVDAAHVNQV